MELFGIGLYTLQQAARLSGVTSSEVSRWLFGYKSNGGKRMSPLWPTQVQGVEEKVIGFRDLMELRVVKAFTRHGVPEKVVRAALLSARELFGLDYPLTSTRFLTDGKSIFYEAMDREGAELTDLAKRQLVFRSITRPQLYDGIEFSAHGEAMRWFPASNKTVVLDPAVSFGRPSLTQYGVPTEIIVQAMRVEQNAKAVAAQFELPVAEVKAAVKFEEQLLAA